MLRTDSKLPPWGRLVLGLLPFVVLVCLYVWGAYHLRAEEAQAGGEATASSKLMPLPSQMWKGFLSTAVEKDSRGNLRLWLDTWASLRRFLYGMGIVAVVGIVVGLYMGTYPVVEAHCKWFFVFIDKTPPLLILPILFIIFDVGELSKVALIVIGVLPGVILDACLRAKEIQREQFYLAQTLGVSEFEIAWSVVLPQIFPKMLDTLRLNFKAAWCYVIAGESIAAAVGIGYRTFILRRYVAMEIIIPYVFWTTLIMFALDYAVQWWQKRYRWVGR